MSIQLVALNPQEHRNLRLKPGHAEASHFTEVMLSEFGSAAAGCPILLAKNPETGAFYAGAMFGFKPDENLLSDKMGGSVPPYRTLDQQREGFYVSEDEIAIDEGCPRFSEYEGDLLFDLDGQPATPLRHIQRVLTQLVHGKKETEAFTATLLTLKLIEPIDISLNFDDGEKLVLQGLYTVSLDTLHELDDAAVLDLFRKGYLQLIYTMVGSLKHIGTLANIRNRRLSRAA
ncbi:SapC family protein [Novosphingobium sp. KN65.2]|uniref:SapC family protein n=1 Tax=Novosphingobium sp. KN65.2 TaxID=1478134 RepID=UPI0005E3C944|nr:SapC family protein [Novosphingobium sp. KN65.2]CDO36537.1 SapC family protein [Novosphingobium sp. KN65.2]